MINKTKLKLSRRFSTPLLSECDIEVPVQHPLCWIRKVQTNSGNVAFSFNIERSSKRLLLTPAETCSACVEPDTPQAEPSMSKSTILELSRFEPSTISQSSSVAVRFVSQNVLSCSRRYIYISPLPLITYFGLRTSFGDTTLKIVKLTVTN